MNAVRDNARQAFAVTGGFLIVVAALGALLRWQSVWPMTGVNYSHWLHAHSHTAFLGWVFNAFLALPLRRFVVPEAGHAFCRLFLLMQVAVLVMLFAYPIEGYGAVSIAFPPFTCCARWCLRGLRGDCGGGIARRRRHGCICAWRWLAPGWSFVGGAAGSELVLVGAPLGWMCPRMMDTLLAATLAMLAGTIVIAANRKRREASPVI